LLKTENLIYKREHILDRKISNFDTKEKDFEQSLKKLKGLKEKLLEAKEKIQKNLEEVSGFSKKEAKEELLKGIEKESKIELIERMRKLDREGEEKLKEKAENFWARADFSKPLMSIPTITVEELAKARKRLQIVPRLHPTIFMNTVRDLYMKGGLSKVWQLSSATLNLITNK